MLFYIVEQKQAGDMRIPDLCDVDGLRQKTVASVYYTISTPHQYCYHQLNCSAAWTQYGGLSATSEKKSEASEDLATRR